VIRALAHSSSPQRRGDLALGCKHFGDKESAKGRAAMTMEEKIGIIDAEANMGARIPTENVYDPGSYDGHEVETGDSSWKGRFVRGASVWPVKMLVMKWSQ
jgi:hypothetical protein